MARPVELDDFRRIAVVDILDGLLKTRSLGCRGIEFLQTHKATAGDELLLGLEIRRKHFGILLNEILEDLSGGGGHEKKRLECREVHTLGDDGFECSLAFATEIFAGFLVDHDVDEFW